MKTITGKIDGIDIQALKGLPQRMQAFVVEQPGPALYVQVTTSDKGLQLALLLASMHKITVQAAYEDDGTLTSLACETGDLFDLAKIVAMYKHAETEDSYDDKTLIRRRILDR